MNDTDDEGIGGPKDRDREPYCANCGKPVKGQGITFNVMGTIYRMCDFVCANAVAGRMNEVARRQTR